MSSKVIPSDIEINEEIVKTVLFEQFQINIQDLKLLGEGWDNSVYLINQHLVFRFPRRKEALPLILREILLLPLLETQNLSLQIPAPTFFGKESKSFARPFYGHELIKGRTGCSIKLEQKEYERLALDLARFLKRSHKIDPQDLGLEGNFEPIFDRTDKIRLTKQLKERITSVEQNYDLKSYVSKFDEIIRNASNYQRCATAVFIHGDLYHRHLLFDDKNVLSGVIDWGDCCIGDPVADLGVVFQFLPKSCHAIFFDEYGHQDKTVLDYAKFLGLYSAAALLWYGHDISDQNLIKTSFWTFKEL